MYALLLFTIGAQIILWQFWSQLIDIPKLHCNSSNSSVTNLFTRPCQDYRNEVGEILVADKQLAEEIEFDLKMLEEEQKKAAAAKAATVSTPQAATPHAQMVSTHTLMYIQVKHTVSVYLPHMPSVLVPKL